MIKYEHDVSLTQTITPLLAFSIHPSIFFTCLDISYCHYHRRHYHHRRRRYI
jgi:hypothetical protein